jgi:hypothetical protein
MPTDPAIFVLFCCFKEEPGCYFSVEIRKNATVDSLKKAILQGNPDLQISARFINLWKVFIPDEVLYSSHDIVREPSKIDQAVKMRSLYQVDAYFDSQPPGRTLHIVAERAHRACWCLRIQLAVINDVIILVQHKRIDSDESSESKSAISVDDVNHSLGLHTRGITDMLQLYLELSPELSVWEPRCGDHWIQDHIKSLRIPFIRSAPFPSLLLHNLGDESYDEQVSTTFLPREQVLK